MKRIAFLLCMVWLVAAFQCGVTPAADEAPGLCRNATALSTDDLTGLRSFFSATYGNYWISSDGWLSAENYCTWQGVACSPISCRVTQLHLGQNGLSGTLPADFHLLSDLEQLDLSCNEIGGSADALAGLHSLTWMVLAQNELSGVLPTFDNWVNINVLDISSNRLSGSLSASLSDSELSWLHVSDNCEPGGTDSGFSGPIPRLPATMTSFLARNNRFTGQFPDQQLPALEELDMRHNQLEGSLPSQLHFSTVLRELDFNSNRIGGEFPSAWLYREDDEERFCDVFLYLERLDIGNNRIEGSIWGLNYASLQVLNVAQNQLSGDLPANMLGTSSTLVTADLTSNSFSSPLLSLSSSLVVVDLRSNPMYCTKSDVPDTIAQDCLYNPRVAPAARRPMHYSNFSCPNLAGIESDCSVLVDPTYYNSAYCECDTHYYGALGKCRSCKDLSGVHCKGRGLIVEAGRYASLDPTTVPVTIAGTLACQPVASETSFFSTQNPCLTTDCELAFNGTLTSCSHCVEGYTGYMCNECVRTEDVCYFASSGSCFKYVTWYEPALGVLLFLIAMTLLTLYYLIPHTGAGSVYNRIATFYRDSFGIVGARSLMFGASSAVGGAPLQSWRPIASLQCCLGIALPVEIVLWLSLLPMSCFILANACAALLKRDFPLFVRQTVYVVYGEWFYMLLLAFSVKNCFADPATGDLHLYAQPSIVCDHSDPTYRSMEWYHDVITSIFGLILLIWLLFIAISWFFQKCSLGNALESFGCARFSGCILLDATVAHEDYILHLPGESDQEFEDRLKSAPSDWVPSLRPLFQYLLGTSDSTMKAWWMTARMSGIAYVAGRYQPSDPSYLVGIGGILAGSFLAEALFPFSTTPHARNLVLQLRGLLMSEDTRSRLPLCRPLLLLIIGAIERILEPHRLETISLCTLLILASTPSGASTLTRWIVTIVSCLVWIICTGCTAAYYIQLLVTTFRERRLLESIEEGGREQQLADAKTICHEEINGLIDELHQIKSAEGYLAAASTLGERIQGPVVRLRSVGPTQSINDIEQKLQEAHDPMVAAVREQRLDEAADLAAPILEMLREEAKEHQKRADGVAEHLEASFYLPPLCPANGVTAFHRAIQNGLRNVVAVYVESYRREQCMAELLMPGDPKGVSALAVAEGNANMQEVIQGLYNESFRKKIINSWEGQVPGIPPHNSLPLTERLETKLGIPVASVIRIVATVGGSAFLLACLVFAFMYYEESLLLIAVFWSILVFLIVMALGVVVVYTLWRIKTASKAKHH